MTLIAASRSGENLHHLSRGIIASSASREISRFATGWRLGNNRSMQFKRRDLRSKHLRGQVAWLALCGMLFGALAPSISQWLAAAGDKAWIEICSASGARSIAIDTGPDSAPMDKAVSVPCPFCLLQNDLPAVSSTNAVILVDRIAVDAEQAFATPRHHDLPFLDAHPSRAPPFLS